MYWSTSTGVSAVILWDTIREDLPRTAVLLREMLDEEE